MLLEHLRELFLYLLQKSLLSCQKDSGGFIIGGTLTGAGWGRGVGMCQTGAQAQALAGREYLQILQHYFPKSISVKLY